MGSLYSKLLSELCSKSSTHEGGHTLLNSNTVGGEDSHNPPDHRTAAANAAEERLRVAQERGTKGGKLAQKLKNSRSGPDDEPRVEPGPVWD